MSIASAIATGVTGGLGLLSNAASNKANHAAVSNAIDTLENTAGYADELYSQGTQNLDSLLQSVTDLYGDSSTIASNLSNATDALSNVSGYTASDFDYGKTIEDFYDPAFNLSVNMANDAINGSQAMGGNLFSSETANKLSAQNQALATQMYNEALSAYQTDKSLESNIWSTEEANKQAEASSALDLAQSQYNVANNAATNLNTANQSYYTGLNNLLGDYYTNKSDYYSNLASLQASDSGDGGILGTIGSWIFG